MEKKTLILFDLDGVLVDTALIHFNAWKRVALDFGITPDSAVERKLRGLSREQSFLTVFGNSSAFETQMNPICTEKNQHFLAELDRMPPEQLLVPNALNLVKALQAQSVQLVIASGSRNAIPILEKTGLVHFFDRIFDGAIPTEKKPDPQYYRNILQQLNGRPETTLLFEDSEACIRAAGQLGIRTIAVNCPEKTRATLHIKSLENLSSASTLDLLHA